MRFRKMFRLPASADRLDHAVDDELRFHIEGRIAEFVQQGMTQARAEAEARRLFGDYDMYRRQTRSIDETSLTRTNRIEWLDAMQREATHAFRALVRTPAFAIIACLTLALGIGATTAIYTVIDRVVLRPLPYPQPDKLVSVMHSVNAPGSGSGRKWGLSVAGYFYFRNHAATLSDIGAYQTSSLSVVDPGTTAIDARLGLVTASMFHVLRARPALGRLLTDADDIPRTPMTSVVLSHEFWRRQYGGDSSIVGKRIATSAGDLEVVGVAAPGLTLPKPGAFASGADLAGFGVDVWSTLRLDSTVVQNNHAYAGIARLAPGKTLEEAQVEITEFTKQFAQLFPTAYGGRFMDMYRFRASVTPLLAEVLGPMTAGTLWIIFGAIALVLMIACANVANLFLVRIESRRREAAVRRALGADARHMAVYHLSETLMLSIAAGAGGLLIARAGIGAILAAAPRNIPRLDGISLDWTSVAFAAVLSIGVGTLFGVLPLLHTHLDVATLREGGRGLTSSRKQRAARNTLVVSQFALALVLLTGAGLMIRSFAHLKNVKPGIDPRGVLTLSVSLPYKDYKSMEDAARFHRQFSDRVKALPGVVAVGAASGLPLRDYGSGCTVVWREHRPYAKDTPVPCVQTVPAIPGFFTALGINVTGRVPDWFDVESKTQAVVVTKALADRLWPGEDPIGKGLGSNGDQSPWWYRIVGVIPELRGTGLDQGPTEAVFLAASPLYPNMSRSGQLNDMEYVIKVERGDPLALVSPVRRILAEMDPKIPLVNPTSMQAIVDRSTARTSFIMLLLACAGSMALVLSAVGIYGVMSYLVAQRRSEIGVRIALGSPVRRVLALVMGQSTKLVLAGLVAGLAGAVAGTRLLRSVLFGVSPMDPLVMAVVPLVLFAIALVATYGPARRAAKVDPVEVLRS